MNWTDYFRSMADHVASKSKDPSTKVGAVLVYPDNAICATGFNGFPRGVNDNVEAQGHRYMRPMKYDFTVHAEANALLTAAKHGHQTEGTTMYVQTFPCANCAALMIQAGVSKVVAPDYADAEEGLWERFRHSWMRADVMFQEAGVEVEFYRGDT